MKRTRTIITRNDFIDEPADRALILVDADPLWDGSQTTLFVAPDNPRAGACVFLQLTGCGEECISLDFEGAVALLQAVESIVEDYAVGGDDE